MYYLHIRRDENYSHVFCLLESKDCRTLIFFGITGCMEINYEDIVHLLYLLASTIFQLLVQRKMICQANVVQLLPYHLPWSLRKRTREFITLLNLTLEMNNLTKILFVSADR